MGEFWQPVFALIAPLQYLATPVCLFLVDQPHQRFLTVIDITAVSARRNEAYGIGLQKLFTQHLIA